MTDTMPDHQEPAEEEARRWIARMASADMTASELAAFKAWRTSDPAHNRAFEAQRALWRAIGKSQPAQHGFAVPGSLRRRHQRWPRTGRIPRIPHPVAASGIAAAFIGAVLFGPNIALMLRADYRTGTATESIGLPDGSTAMLDAGSAIALSYTGNERRIDLLRGDAWFNVAHGDHRPFRVAALGGVTQDVGTAFEVRREADAVSVAVTRGAVRVYAPGERDGLPLHAAQRVRYGGNAPASRLDDVDPTDIAAWRQGEILIDHATVADAVAQIGRYRSAPVFVIGTPAVDQRVSGVFRVDRPDAAINAVARMGRFSIYRLGGIMILRSST